MRFAAKSDVVGVRVYYVMLSERYVSFEFTRVVVSRSPGEIHVTINLVFSLLLHGCYEGFPF